MKIIIAGKACEGKTAIARIIAKALVEEGFKPGIENRDGDFYGKTPEQHDKCVKAMIERGTDIAIYEVHEQRDGQIPYRSITVIDIDHRNWLTTKG